MQVFNGVSFQGRDLPRSEFLRRALENPVFGLLTEFQFTPVFEAVQEQRQAAQQLADAMQQTLLPALAPPEKNTPARSRL